jgi:hypothetical protein
MPAGQVSRSGRAGGVASVLGGPARGTASQTVNGRDSVLYVSQRTMWELSERFARLWQEVVEA